LCIEFGTRSCFLHKKPTIPDDMGILSPAVLALSRTGSERAFTPS
jgi:hypothetical protein